MNSYKHLAWKAFETTGGVREYLKYKALDKNDTSVEAGEEFGTFKNIGNSDKDHQVR
ncbi:MAG: hypothetical protein IKT39_05230 [Clostridia bacterium]|nr:hypothetical protein [Clostridia bacterium]MBR6523990.1 hypothetical protein [Clostridia bacterium]